MAFNVKTYTEPKTNDGQAKSARNNRKNWKEDLPPKQFRVKVEDAIKVAGNQNRLAKALGISRGAVYQWRPPYRHDPYMPLKSAIAFLEIPEYREKLKGMDD